MKGQFAAALNAPFSEAALGAQIPDVYSYPTDTRHFRQSFTVTTDGSGAAEIVVLPNPIMSITAQQRGFITGGVNYVYDCVSGGTNIGTAQSAYPGAPIANAISFPNSVLASGGTGNGNIMLTHGCITQSELAKLFVKFRVVGWGYKIRALGNLSTTQGRIQVASVPAPNLLPCASEMELSAGGAVPVFWPQCEAFYSIFGSSSGGSPQTGRGDFVRNFLAPAAGALTPAGFSGNLLDYPINVEATAVQLQTAPLRGHGKVCGKLYDEWRNTAAFFSGGLVSATGAMYDVGETFNTWTGSVYAASTTTLSGALGSAIASKFQFDSNNMDGWNCVPIAFIGCGAFANFEVELIYHVEGVPLLAIGNQVSNRGLGGGACHHDPVEVMAALTTNATSGSFFL